MNLKLWVVIVGVILVFNLVQFLGSREVDAKLETLEEAISKDKQNLTLLEDSLKYERSKIDAKKAQMDKMSDKEYNKNVDPYNALVEKYKLDISKYNAQIKMVNVKVDQYNEIAKNSGETYIIPGLPRR